MAKMLEIKIGRWVAFNNLENAAWFKIEDIDHHMMRIREGKQYAAQYMDKSLVKQVSEKKPVQR